MDILIIRHGDAVDDAPGLGDAGRWLTGKGRKVTRGVAAWLAHKDRRRPVEIWTSPLVRAVQTAEIIASSAELSDAVSVLAELSTAGHPNDVHRRLAEYAGLGPLALVGHEPSLSALAVSLLGDVPWPGFKKSGVLGLKWSGSGLATFGFVLDPKELSTITDLTRLAR